MGTAGAISVSIVDYQPMFRLGLLHTLRAERQMRIVFEGEGANEALRFAKENEHDVMLLGVEMPSGLDAVEALARLCPATRVIVLSASEDEAIVSKSLGFGARGYMLRDVGPTELVNAIRGIQKGSVYLTPRLGARLLARVNSAVAAPSHPRHDLNHLTTREDQILAKVSEGFTNKEIARSLDISEKTVKYYMTNIMQKLQVRNRVEAVVVSRERKSA
jgi:DNA-binding NarL/FixJ family response regulator